MQHLAINDILVAVFRLAPMILALISDRWIAGESFCHIDAHAGFVSGGATLILTCSLATLKLLIMKYPLRTRTLASSTKLVLNFFELKLSAHLT